MVPCLWPSSAASVWGDGAAELCAPPSSCSAPWLCSGAADLPTGSNREKLTGLWVGVCLGMGAVVTGLGHSQAEGGQGLKVISSRLGRGSESHTQSRGWALHTALPVCSSLHRDPSGVDGTVMDNSRDTDLQSPGR